MVKIHQVDLFMMYFDPFTSYQHEHIQVFCDIVDNICTTISPKIGLLTSTMVHKPYLFVLLVILIKFTF
jgi:hypothetical protein